MSEFIDKLGVKSKYRISMVNGDAVQELEQERDELFENLFDSCEVICQLCVRLNPQHENCTECDELNDLRKPITDKIGLSWEQIKELL